MNVRTIDVWSTALDVSDERLRDSERVLTPDETDRSRRFLCSEHRRRWTVARGMLRTILARYSDAAPEEIRFRYDVNGRPSLAYPLSQPELHFNLAHSGALMLVGVTQAGPLGVDVEHVRGLCDVDGIIDRFFSPTEQAAIRELPKSQRTEAFYNCWTRKESYLKALGLGLSLPLDSFDVSVRPGEPARLLSVRGDLEKARSWSLFHLESRPDYVGALAIQSSNRYQVRQYQIGTESADLLSLLSIGSEEDRLSHGWRDRRGR